VPISDADRARTRERFEAHRRAWQTNAALRALYAEWYGRVGAALPPASLGPRVELGSGPGFARDFIPDLLLTDVVGAPWHDRECSADALPFPDGGVGALVLFDVLHHLTAPRAFFAEATRALAAGGRIILCEPYVSPLSYPIYRWFHEEPLDLRVDPLATHGADDRDPFDSNQAIPTLMFGRGRPTFEAAFPALRIMSVEQLAGPSYPASGGFSRGPLLPGPLWSALHRVERWLPAAVIRQLAFRMLVVLEKSA
jgi:SAM-dependent methyltransferase